MDLQNQISLFIDKIKRFDYPINNLDPIWEILFEFPKGHWQYLHVLQYQESFTINCMIGEGGILKWNAKDDINIWDSYNHEYNLVNAEEGLILEWVKIFKAANRWLNIVEEDWLSANRKVMKEFPYEYRKGVISNQIVYSYLPELFQWRKNLDEHTIQKFLDLTSDGEFANIDKGKIKKLSAKKYFEYCKVAYTVSAKSDDYIDTSLIGREMYRRYADGRHEGLLDIDENSKRAFADWLDDKHPLRKKGGHPWEIRGGRIWLYVRRKWQDKDSFLVELSGGVTGSLVEEIQIYIALMEANLLVSLSRLNEKRRRICLQDNLGILPLYESTLNADHEFNEEDEVSDGIYYSDLGKYKDQLSPFISWKTLPLLKPKKKLMEKNSGITK